MAEEMEKPSEAMLATLTPEERAAVEDDELSPAERAALEEIAGDDDEDEDDEDEDDTTAKGAAADDANAKGATQNNESVAEEDEEDKEPAQKFAPKYRVDLPADFADQVSALDEGELALATKFKAGEIEAEQFLTEQKEITVKRAALQTLRSKTETFEEMNRQSAEQEWEWSIKSFMRQVKKADGVDYVKDADKANDFDTFIKVLAANPANADKDYDWFLSMAHKRVKVLHAVNETSAPKPNADDAKGNIKTKPSRKPNLTAIPKTLAQVPGGEGPGDVNDEFVSLDALEGFEYEQALARMTPAQRDKYLKAA